MKGAIAHFFLLVSLAVVVVLATGCVTVRFNQKRRLADDAMQLDANPFTAAFAGKVHDSREGATGGFHGSGAGGCGCN